MSDHEYNEQELTQYNDEETKHNEENNAPQGILVTTLEEEQLAVIDMNDNEVKYCPNYNCTEKYSDHMLFKMIRFYLDPITKDFKYSMRCFLYNSLYFPITLGLALFDGYAIGGSIIMTILACVGLVLLWFTFEFILMLSNIDLKLTYYLVQKENELNPGRKHLIQLSLYTKKLPFCCCWNDEMEHNPWYHIMVERVKYLYISLNLYIIIAYHIILKPFICLCTVWPIFIVIYMCFWFIIPFWYAINSSLFDRSIVCPFGGYESNDGVSHCVAWNVSSMGIAFLMGLIGLLLLPLSLKLNNFTANVSKIAAYYFYTYYYTKNEDIVNDKRSLIDSNGKSNKPIMINSAVMHSQ